ncbi:MAG TPA: hypothetical protein VF502_09020 [Stellaceae bacterium]
MHELQPHPGAERAASPAVPPAQPAATVMTRLEHWRHVLTGLEREAAETRHADIELLLGMTILAVEDAIAAASGVVGHGNTTHSASGFRSLSARKGPAAERRGRR